MLTSSEDREAYMAGVHDQLSAAVAHGDGETAERIVDQVDADGYTAAAAALGHALDRTSAAVPDAPTLSIDTVLSNTLRDAALQLVALCQWIDGAPANAARDPEALLWVRCAKVSEEAGEVVDALNRATGANPRKPVRASMDEVRKELLDVALTALNAFEHTTGCTGLSIAALFSHIEATYRRAGLHTADGTE